MVRSAWLVVGLISAAFPAPGASAASVEYCTLYAQAFVDIAALRAHKMGEPALTKADGKRLFDTSWAKCLNRDEDPELSLDLTETNPAGAVGTVPSSGATAGAGAPAKTRPDQVAEDAGGTTGAHRGSGYKAWTPEWLAWCSSHYRSFDPKTGTIKPFLGRPTLCQ